MKSQDMDYSIWINRIKAAVFPIAAFLLVFLFFRECLFICYVPTDSMEPTIAEGTLAVGIRRWLCGEITTGDIVVVRQGNTLLLKRVIGAAGDEIRIEEGTAYCNGDRSPWGDGECPGEFLGPHRVPDGCLFLLGDNRDSSWDARYWKNPYTPLDAIWGKL